MLLASLSAVARAVATVQTTTTTYQYNADHALTAATTTTNGQSTTVYFTWDNCVPSATTPSSCTVSAGNGNLLGVGAAPGTDDALQFGFDQRNRLISAAASGAQSSTYAYHPASLLATSTLASGDALDFTYDTSPLPQVTNIQQSSTGTWASYLGDTTYLSDGTEQVLCQPRKDVAGVYEPPAGSLTPLRYDPYGSVESASDAATSPATGATSYDMSENPFRYAGEYMDPAWGGVYLRARWYLPEYQIFLGRDPADAIHRYGYAGGDPVGNVDPSGLSYRSFSRSADNALRPLTSGAMRYITPWLPLIGGLVGGAMLLANLPEVWHHPSERTWLNFGFLVGSAAVETAFELPGNLGMSAGNAFFARHLADLVIGGGQTVLASDHKGKWDVPSLIESVEYNLSGMIGARELAGIGYRPYAMRVSDVNEFAKGYFSDPAHEDQLLLFVGKAKTKWTTPITDALGLDFPAAHTQLNWLGQDRYGFTDLPAGHDANSGNPWVNVRYKNNSGTDFTGGGPAARLRYVGTIEASAMPDQARVTSIEYQRQIYTTWGRRFGGAHDFDAPYNKYTNNCQHYIQGMKSQLVRK